MKNDKNVKTYPLKWDAEMVSEYYDSHLNCTLHELSALSGWTRKELLRLLNGKE